MKEQIRMLKFKKISREKIRKFLFGMNLTDGFLFRFFIYLLLIGIGYVYLFPILFMISYSFKDLSDLLNPMVNWIPTKLYMGNYTLAFSVLNYFQTLLSSLKVTLIPAVVQTLSASLIGYGFARFKFPLKNFLLVLVVITFIIPPDVVMIPKYVMFTKLHLTGTSYSIIVPALFGQGLNAAVFVLIFFQFFRMIPKSLDEAALIDGANRYYVFLKIAVPLAIPAFITSFLFSFVWYWNETFISSLFLESKITTLQLMLANFVSAFEAANPGKSATMVNEGVVMAGTLLIILPMLIVYFAMQKGFIEGVDRTGITGE